MKTKMRIQPVNPAEAVIAAFFDRTLSPEDEWVLVPGRNTKNLRMGRGYTTSVFWDACGATEAVFVWSWQGTLDLATYDGFFLQAAFPADVTLKFTAQVDGQWQTIVPAATGCNTNDDYAGDFTGTTLHSLRLEFSSRSGAAGGFTTYYLGVYNQRRLADWLAYENTTVYDKEWSEFIKPRHEWGALQPELGLYFNAGEMDALRARMESAPYRRYAHVLREEVRALCEAREPEREIRTYLAVGASPFSYSARSRDRKAPLWRLMEHAAFFGLLDNDPELIRMAARCLLSTCHCRHWAEGFVEHDFPGSAVEFRSFYQNQTCVSVVAAFDWIGGVLTEHAKGVIAQSVYFKGLAPIKYDFAKYAYIYEMNQATVFSIGRISALLMLDKMWPRVGWELRQARADLDETVSRIIHADGGFGEGPVYYSAVMFFVLGSYLLLAKGAGECPQAALPPGIRRGADYFGMFVSTAGKSRRLPISDGTWTTFDSDWTAMFAHLTADARWNDAFVNALDGQTEKIVSRNLQQIWLHGGVRSVMYGPDDLSDRKPIIPVFNIHRDSGHLTSCRPTADGFVYLHLVGSSRTEGHSHEDKGSFILEVFGESLLVDRGMTPYSDPMCPVLKKASMHNVVVVEIDGEEAPQVNPCPGPVCPEGRGDEKVLHTSIDITPAWGAAAKRVVRKIDSDDPCHYAITDEIVLLDALPVTFNLHSHYPVRASGNTAVFAATKSALCVTWEWDGEVVRAFQELHDGEYKPVYQLAVRSKPGRTHTLVTKLAINATGSALDRAKKGA